MANVDGVDTRQGFVIPEVNVQMDGWRGSRIIEVPRDWVGGLRAVIRREETGIRIAPSEGVATMEERVGLGSRRTPVAKPLVLLKAEGPIRVRIYRPFPSKELG